METLVNNFTLNFILQTKDDDTRFIAEEYGNRLCHFMGFEEMQKLIKNPPEDPPYDLVITEAFGAHCYMGLGYVFKVPVIAISSAIEYPWVSYFIGNDDNLAYVPNALHIGAGQMNFYERLKNVFLNYIEMKKFHKVTEISQTESMRKYLSPDIPNIREIEKNVALTLVNSNFVLSGIKPTTPALVQVAGIHINAEDQILSANLKKWMDESVHGVIYFSFGSMVLIESFPQNQVKDFYACFTKIAPIRVLMKIANDTNLPKALPSNVKTLSWIPQQAILAHPNTKIFITHGGLGGVQEALYFGIPMIGIPLFGDQFRNVEVFVAKQTMLKIDREQISKKTLGSAIDALIHNSIYKDKVKYYSKLFRDQPMSPMETAIYWIEYIIRNGDKVLRSPALELSFIQLSQLDIYGFLLIVTISILSMLIMCVKFLINIFKNKFISTAKTKKILTKKTE
ncbi:UDP-glucosyltransferase 2-like isoform X2 [Phymastichus coffea]|nr:UDP-glucosyltransferase 2-like isoform X2 [Phymastichus coffea]